MQPEGQHEEGAPLEAWIGNTKYTKYPDGKVYVQSGPGGVSHEVYVRYKDGCAVEIDGKPVTWARSDGHYIPTRFGDDEINYYKHTLQIEAVGGTPTDKHAKTTGDVSFLFKK